MRGPFPDGIPSWPTLAPGGSHSTRTARTRGRAGRSAPSGKTTAPWASCVPRRMPALGWLVARVAATIEAMIHDVDQLLEKLVRRDALNGSSVELVFEAPTKDWVARRSGPAVDLYLYDIREDLQRRVPAWEDVRGPDGIGHRTAPAAAALPARLPRHGLDPATRGRAPPPVVAAVVLPAQPDDPVGRGSAAARRHRPAGLPRRRAAGGQERSLADIWSALGGELKPSLDLVVTAPDLGRAQRRRSGRPSCRGRTSGSRPLAAGPAERGRARQAWRSRDDSTPPLEPLPEEVLPRGATGGGMRIRVRRSPPTVSVAADARRDLATGRARRSRRRRTCARGCRSWSAASVPRSIDDVPMTPIRATASAACTSRTTQVDRLLDGPRPPLVPATADDDDRRLRHATRGASPTRRSARGTTIRLRTLARAFGLEPAGRRAAPGRARARPRPALRAAVRLPPRRRLAAPGERRAGARAVRTRTRRRARRRRARRLGPRVAAGRRRPALVEDADRPVADPRAPRAGPGHGASAGRRQRPMPRWSRRCGDVGRRGDRRSGRRSPARSPTAFRWSTCASVPGRPATRSARDGAARGSGRPVVELDLARLAAGDDPAELAAAASREARLRDGGLVVGPDRAACRSAARPSVRAFAERPGPVDPRRRRATGTRPGRGSRRSCWTLPWPRSPSGTSSGSARFAGAAPDGFDPAVATLAFRLTPEQIVRAARRSPARPPRPSSGPRP